jgi:hypothetical protein
MFTLLFRFSMELNFNFCSLVKVCRKIKITVWIRWLRFSSHKKKSYVFNLVLAAIFRLVWFSKRRSINFFPNFKKVISILDVLVLWAVHVKATILLWNEGLTQRNALNHKIVLMWHVLCGALCQIHVLLEITMLFIMLVWILNFACNYAQQMVFFMVDFICKFYEINVGWELFKSKK